MMDVMLTMGSRTATSEDLFFAIAKMGPALVGTFETSNELIMKGSGILARG